MTSLRPDYCRSERPCPYTACRYNLANDGTEGCVLDIADQGPLSCDDVAEVLGTSGAMVHKWEKAALKSLRRQLLTIRTPFERQHRGEV